MRDKFNMKTSELIKQAEKLLNTDRDNRWRWFYVEGDTDIGLTEEEATFISFARNHMQELIDRLKRSDEVLLKIKTEVENKYIKNTEDAFSFINYITTKALEEE